MLLSLRLSDLFPGTASGDVSDNVVGYAAVPCLVPCRPDQADGSPTNVVYDLKLLPDIAINGLIQTNGEIYGVGFAWTNSSTLVLQGTHDLNAWTNIAYIWSNPPETVWTTNTPLNSYGDFFRVALVADGHSTNLPPLGAALEPLPRSTVDSQLAVTTARITDCRFANGKVWVSVSTLPGQTVQVQAVNASGVILQTRVADASGASVVAAFAANSLPNPVFFQTRTASADVPSTKPPRLP